MPAKIPQSAVKALDFDFAQAVSGYKQALADWHARPSDWDPVPIPMPPHPLVAVAAAVDSFEIFDDTPPPPPPPPPLSLEERKALFAGEIERLGSLAMDRLVPPLKRPLLELQLQDALRVPEKERSHAQRDVINNRKGIDEQIMSIRLKVAQLHDRLHDMDEEAFEIFVKKPRPVIE